MSGILMEMHIKGNLETVKLTVMEFRYGQMERNMMVSGRWACVMGWVYGVE
jgi:hypothetical protein